MQRQCSNSGNKLRYSYRSVTQQNICTRMNHIMRITFWSAHKFESRDFEWEVRGEDITRVKHAWGSRHVGAAVFNRLSEQNVNPSVKQWVCWCSAWWQIVNFRRKRRLAETRGLRSSKRLRTIKFTIISVIFSKRMDKHFMSWRNADFVPSRTGH